MYLEAGNQSRCGYAVGRLKERGSAGWLLAMGGYGVPEDSEMLCDVDAMIASPCIGICTLDPQTELCLGCLRTGAEIAVWRDADSNLRLRILDRVSLRRTMRYGISMRTP